jgi:hypothetical protein
MLQQCNITSTEEWRAIPGLPNFEASDHGRLRRTFNNGNVRIVTGNMHKSGYLRLHLTINGRRRVLRIHRLIAKVFLGDCPRGLVVNHVDGVKLNNQASNLEYVTHRENILHAWRLGLASWEQRPRFTHPRRLTDQDIEFIRTNQGLLTQAQIGKRLGVSGTMVSKIQKGYEHKSPSPVTAA